MPENKKVGKPKRTHPSEPCVPGAPDDLEHPLERVDDRDVERPPAQIDDEHSVVLERQRLLFRVLRRRLGQGL